MTVVSKEKNVVLYGTGFFSYILEFQFEDPKADSKICKGVLQQDLVNKLWGFFLLNGCATGFWL